MLRELQKRVIESNGRIDDYKLGRGEIRRIVLTQMDRRNRHVAQLPNRGGQSFGVRLVADRDLRPCRAMYLAAATPPPCRPSPITVTRCPIQSVAAVFDGELRTSVLAESSAAPPPGSRYRVEVMDILSVGYSMNG